MRLHDHDHTRLQGTGSGGDALHRELFTGSGDALHRELFTGSGSQLHREDGGLGWVHVSFLRQHAAER